MADNNGKPLHEIMAELLANNGSQDSDKNKNVVGKTNTKVQIEKTDENVVDEKIDTDTIIKSAPFVKDPNGTQDEQVDGLAKGILVVSDPEITSEDFEEVADELQGIVDKTDAGELPYTDKYKGDYILSCPICGGTFVSDKLLENGEDTCPICCKVPDSFVVNGKIEGEESVENKDDVQEEIEHEENLKEVPEEDLEEKEPEDVEDQEESPLRKESKEMSGNKLQEEKEVKTEYYSMSDNEHIIWDSENSLDDFDLDDLRDNQYQDYLDEFDDTITPMSYEEWLDSDECANLFELEWEAAAKESDEYAEWYDFITDYVSEEEKEEAYNDYVESCKNTTLKPDSFEEWLDNNISSLSEDVWEVKEEDLESNILPEIDNQLNSDILLLTGSYGSNYPDFKSSGNGGKLFKGIDDFRNYMGNWDRVCITTQEGVLGAILDDHDGTVSGQFYTIPTGKDKIEMLRKMGYEERLSEEYEEEEIDKYGAEGLMEDIFDNDMYYDGLDARDFSDVADMLVPVKDTISGYTSKEENKKVESEDIPESDEELEELED